LEAGLPVPKGFHFGEVCAPTPWPRLDLRSGAHPSMTPSSEISIRTASADDPHIIRIVSVINAWLRSIQLWL
jgi:hypothetical protein